MLEYYVNNLNWVWFLQLYPEQVVTLVDAFKNPAQAREEGLYFDNKQFKCVRADKNSLYAKHVSIIACRNISDAKLLAASNTCTCDV